MPAARRLLVVFLVLIGAFLVLVGFAVASLYTVGQPVLAAVVATAGLAGVGAGVLTYWLVKRDGIAEEFDFEIQIPTSTVAATESTAVANARAVVAEELATPEAATPAHVARRPRIVRRPTRVQSMPVAELPPEYVNAVMRGAQARLSALKAESRGAESR